MGKLQAMRDFSKGVVNQEMQNHDEGNGVFFAAKNVVSSWNGELGRRTGTHWVKSLDGPVRIVPFRKPDGNDIILLLRKGGVEGYTFADDEHIEPFYVPGGAAPSFPTSGWAGNTTNGDYTIAISSDSAQSTWGAGFDTYLGNKYYNQGSLYTGGYDSTTNVPATIDISSTTAQVLGSVRIRWCNTCSGNHKGHYKGWIDPIIQYSDDGTNWTSVVTDVRNPLPFGGSDAYRASYLYGSGSAQKTENYVVYQVTNVDHMNPHQYWRIYMRLRIQNNQVYSGERLDLFVSDVTYTSTTMIPFSANNAFFTEENIYDIKFSQHDTTMILTNGTDPALQIVYAAGGLSLANHNNTINYNTEGYPKCVAFYQNRLFFGGFSAQPTKVLGSAFGNYSDFTIPATILATSPISAQSVEIKSIIENLWGAPTALYALSADGISMIDGGGIAVSTDHVEFKLRNHEPVDGMTPTVKNDMMIYLGRDRQKIFLTDYDLVVQRFRAVNISKKYSNYLKAGVKELHIIPDRTDLIYGVLSDGQMFSILFDAEQQVNGLFPIETNGFVNDIEPIKYQDNTKLCLVVQRNGVWQLEFKDDKPIQEIMDFMSEDEKKLYTREVLLTHNYLDCATRRSYSPATKIIGDLPYGAGQEVEVFADGRYLGKKTLSVSSDAGLVAWKYGDTVLYTTTTSPTTSSLVYDSNGEVMPGYTISAVAAGEITVYHYQQRLVSYYAYEKPLTITVDVTTANPNVSVSAPVGVRTFTRDASLDESSSYVNKVAWKSGQYVICTSNEYGVVYAQGNHIEAFNANIRKGWTTAFTKTKKFIKNSVPNMGDTVYNDDFTVSGVVEAKEEISYAGTTIYKLTIDGGYYYTATADDVVEQEEEAVYETFARYSDGDLTYDGVALILEEEASDVIVGLSYQAYAVIKFVTPYMFRKFPREIAVNFINSGYLEVGNLFSDLRPALENIVENVTLDNMPVLMNGNYEKTVDKQAFETPYVIINSDKGFPFIVTGIDYEVDYSNYQGGV